MAVARSGEGTGSAPGRPADASPSPALVPPAVEVRRSGRRRRTVSAYREGGRTIVLIPARFTKAEERHWVDTMLGRLAAGDRRRRPDDAELSARARALSSRYLDGAARPTSVRWVGNQMSRWGSCTPADRTIRVSERLKGMPGYVLYYVLLHELAHLLRPAHDREFWRLLSTYPRVERARGYLEGVASAAGLGASWQEGDDTGEVAQPEVDEVLVESTTLF
jgi:predicted metal-dependent hydrolase